MGDALHAFGDLPDDLLTGIIGTETTIFYGASGVGKGRLLAEIIAAGLCGRPFAGRDWSRPVRRVAVIGTDAGAPREYARWVRRAGAGIEHEKNLKIWAVDHSLSERDWDEVTGGVTGFDPSMIIIDSTTEIIPGSVNDDTQVRSFWQSTAPFREAEIPMVMVHHVAKPGPESKGRAGSTPMGSALWENYSRNKVNVYQSAGQVVMSCRPRHSGPWEARFDEDPDTGQLTLSGTRDAKAIRERKNDQHAERVAKDHELADWIVEHCQGLSKVKVGDAVAARFGGSAETHRRNLDPARKIGGLVSCGPKNQWSRTGH